LHFPLVSSATPRESNEEEYHSGSEQKHTPTVELGDLEVRFSLDIDWV